MLHVHYSGYHIQRKMRLTQGIDCAMFDSSVIDVLGLVASRYGWDHTLTQMGWRWAKPRRDR